MLDTDVSDSDLWTLRRRELAAWTFVLCAACAPLLFSHRRLSSAAEIRIQPPAGSASQPVLATGGTWRLDVNTASESELELLPGLGAGLARAIVRERERRGVFHSIWELSEAP